MDLPYTLEIGMPMVIGLEILMVVIVLLFIFMAQGLSAKVSDKEAIKSLAAKIKKSRSHREEVIRKYLKNLGFTKELADEKSSTLFRGEMKCIKRFSMIYLKRDIGAVSQFPMSMESLIDLYWALLDEGTFQGVPGDEASEEEGGVDASELEAMREENQRLSEELRVTMDTMSRMLNEYTTVFVTDDADGAQTKNTADSASASNGTAAVAVAVAAASDEIADAFDIEMPEDLPAAAPVDSTDGVDDTQAEGDDWAAALAEQDTAEGGGSEDAADDWAAALAEQEEASDGGGAEDDWAAALAEQEEATGEATEDENGEDDDWAAALAEQAEASDETDDMDDLDDLFDSDDTS